MCPACCLLVCVCVGWMLIAFNHVILYLEIILLSPLSLDFKLLIMNILWMVSNIISLSLFLMWLNKSIISFFSFDVSFALLLPFRLKWICMGGRLPAVAGMPANRTFLELSAGQSDWPEKNSVVLLPKNRRRPVSFRHEEKRFSLWTAPCLSIKSGVY